MFVNTLSADGKYPVQYCENVQLPIQMQLSGIQKIFLEFLVPFLESTSNFKHFGKKMIAWANAFPKIQTVKNFVTPLCKKRCLRTRLVIRHVKVLRILVKCPWGCFYHVFSSIWWKLIGKKSPLGLGEIYLVFVNTLTADGKYPVEYCENLQLPIQMQVSRKGKTFLQFFVPFPESTSNFKHFEIKDDCHS